MADPMASSILSCWLDYHFSAHDLANRIYLAFHVSDSSAPTAQ
jgi:hypothetical protein